MAHMPFPPMHPPIPPAPPPAYGTACGIVGYAESTLPIWDYSGCAAWTVETWSTSGGGRRRLSEAGSGPPPPPGYPPLPFTIERYMEAFERELGNTAGNVNYTWYPDTGRLRVHFLSRLERDYQVRQQLDAVYAKDLAGRGPVTYDPIEITVRTYPPPPPMPPRPPPSPSSPPLAENAYCVDGEWPLFETLLEAAAHSQGGAGVRAVTTRGLTLYTPNYFKGRIGLQGACPSYAKRLRDVCEPSGADDVCSPFANAEWSAAFISSYHFYLYDETPDGLDLRLWEWPRVTPKDDQLANNGVCEDGQPAVNASIPEGDYYVAFGGADCATHHVNLSTGLIAGCGRVDLVPCTVGTDCHDCGRSASLAARQQQDSVALARRRRAQALPALSDAHELHHLNRTLATATSWHLPKAWLEALRVMDHPVHP